MKKVFICVIAAACTAGAVTAQTKSTVKPAVKTTAPTSAKSIMKNLNDSFSYAAGMNIASSMKDQGITKLNNALMQKAIHDVFNNGKLLLTKEQCNMTLQEQLQIFSKKKGDEQKAKNNSPNTLEISALLISSIIIADLNGLTR